MQQNSSLQILPLQQRNENDSILRQLARNTTIKKIPHSPRIVLPAIYTGSRVSRHMNIYILLQNIPDSEHDKWFTSEELAGIRQKYGTTTCYIMT